MTQINRKHFNKNINRITIHSLFVKENRLDATKHYVNELGPYYLHDVVRSCTQHSFLYDMTYLQYYCMYKGLTFEDMNKQRFRYNSGLYIVARDFITEKSLKEYIDFAKDINEKKAYYSSLDLEKANFMTLPYDDTKDDLFHPSDEVYWQYLMIQRNKSFVSTLTPEWNFIGSIQHKRHLYLHNHVHCIDKNEIEKVLKSKARLKTLIKKELIEIKEMFGEERKSPIIELQTDWHVCFLLIHWK